MNYALSDEQAGVLAGLEQLIEARCPAAPVAPRYFNYSEELERAVAEAGYLEIAAQEGFGALEGALIVERLARLPWLVEVAASALVAPVLGMPATLSPVALVAGDYARPARFLPMAKVLLVDRGAEVLMVELQSAQVEPVDTLMAYPYGRLRSLTGLQQRVFADARAFRRRWRIALAAEAAGCMAAALALVVDHVKTRHAFGRPLGANQAVQHRLAAAAETVESAKWLAFRAAWSDGEADAALAATFVQTRIASLTYDLHQFCGAMGLTLEFPLHLWTYRLRALAGELGGANRQARTLAQETWGTAA